MFHPLGPFRALLFLNCNCLAVAQTRRRFHRNRVSGIEPGHDFDIAAARMAKRNRLPLDVIVFIEEDDFLAVVVVHGIGRITTPAGPFCSSGALPRNATLIPMSGSMRGSSFKNEIRTFTVAFWRSAVGISFRFCTVSSSRDKRQGLLRVTGSPGFTRAM